MTIFSGYCRVRLYVLVALFVTSFISNAHAVESAFCPDSARCQDLNYYEMLKSDEDIKKIADSIESKTQEATKDFPKEDREKILMDHQAWKDFVGVACWNLFCKKNSSDSENADNIRRCVQQQYAYRKNHTQKLVEKKNGITFAFIGKYNVRLLTYSRVATDNTVFPQIIFPKNKNTEAWNKRVEMEAQSYYLGECGRNAQNSVSYTITGVSKDQVSIEFDNGQYCEGTPHGYSYKIKFDLGVR